MHTEFIDYEINNFVMEGFLAVGESTGAKQPVVLVVHDWSGNRDFAQEKARYFAKQGFIAFAVDLYGKGKRGSDTDRSVNEKLIGELLQHRHVIIERLQAAIDCVKNIANVDMQKIMLIGFCMGGMASLDFARSGVKVSGVVSVHGLLIPPSKVASTKKIHAKVLVLHGHEDKSTDTQQVIDFETEMTACAADWQVHIFGHTHHAFTNPKENDLKRGLVYSPTANARTWVIVRGFTDEIFA